MVEVINELNLLCWRRELSAAERTVSLALIPEVSEPRDLLQMLSRSQYLEPWMGMKTLCSSWACLLQMRTGAPGSANWRVVSSKRHSLAPGERDF